MTDASHNHLDTNSLLDLGDSDQDQGLNSEAKQVASYSNLLLLTTFLHSLSDCGTVMIDCS